MDNSIVISTGRKFEHSDYILLPALASFMGYTHDLYVLVFAGKEKRWFLSYNTNIKPLKLQGIYNLPKLSKLTVC